MCIVDDDSSTLRALERLLRSRGVQAATFASGRELLSDPSRKKAACFLLDVQMPEMTGFELARRLATEATSGPVIFITAHPEETTARAIEAGGCTLLRKPFGDNELTGALRLACGEDFIPAGT